MMETFRFPRSQLTLGVIWMLWSFGRADGQRCYICGPSEEGGRCQPNTLMNVPANVTIDDSMCTTIENTDYHKNVLCAEYKEPQGYFFECIDKTNSQFSCRSSCGPSIESIGTGPEFDLLNNGNGLLLGKANRGSLFDFSDFSNGQALDLNNLGNSGVNQPKNGSGSSGDSSQSSSGRNGGFGSSPSSKNIFKPNLFQNPGLNNNVFSSPNGNGNINAQGGGNNANIFQFKNPFTNNQNSNPFQGQGFGGSRTPNNSPFSTPPAENQRLANGQPNPFRHPPGNVNFRGSPVNPSQFGNPPSNAHLFESSHDPHLFGSPPGKKRPSSPREKGFSDDDNLSPLDKNDLSRLQPQVTSEPLVNGDVPSEDFSNSQSDGPGIEDISNQPSGALNLNDDDYENAVERRPDDLPTGVNVDPSRASLPLQAVVTEYPSSPAAQRESPEQPDDSGKYDYSDEEQPHSPPEEPSQGDRSSEFSPPSSDYEVAPEEDESAYEEEEEEGDYPGEYAQQQPPRETVGPQGPGSTPEEFYPEETESQENYYPEETESQENYYPEDTESQENYYPEETESQENYYPEETESPEDNYPEEEAISPGNYYPEETGTSEGYYPEETESQEDYYPEETESPQDYNPPEKETISPEDYYTEETKSPEDYYPDQDVPRPSIDDVPYPSGVPSQPDGRSEGPRDAGNARDTRPPAGRTEADSRRPVAFREASRGSANTNEDADDARRIDDVRDSFAQNGLKNKGVSPPSGLDGSRLRGKGGLEDSPDYVGTSLQADSDFLDRGGRRNGEKKIPDQFEQPFQAQNNIFPGFNKFANGEEGSDPRSEESLFNLFGNKNTMPPGFQNGNLIFNNPDFLLPLDYSKTKDGGEDQGPNGQDGRDQNGDYSNHQNQQNYPAKQDFAPQRPPSFQSPNAAINLLQQNPSGRNPPPPHPPRNNDYPSSRPPYPQDPSPYNNRAPPPQAPPSQNPYGNYPPPQPYHPRPSPPNNQQPPPRVRPPYGGPSGPRDDLGNAYRRPDQYGPPPGYPRQQPPPNNYRREPVPPPPSRQPQNYNDGPRGGFNPYGPPPSNPYPGAAPPPPARQPFRPESPYPVYPPRGRVPPQGGGPSSGVPPRGYPDPQRRPTGYYKDDQQAYLPERRNPYSDQPPPPPGPGPQPGYPYGGRPDAYPPQQGPPPARNPYQQNYPPADGFRPGPQQTPPNQVPGLGGLGQLPPVGQGQGVQIPVSPGRPDFMAGLAQPGRGPPQPYPPPGPGGRGGDVGGGPYQPTGRGESSPGASWLGRLNNAAYRPPPSNPNGRRQPQGQGSQDPYGTYSVVDSSPFSFLDPNAQPTLTKDIQHTLTPPAFKVEPPRNSDTGTGSNRPLFSRDLPRAAAEPPTNENAGSLYERPAPLVYGDQSAPYHPSAQRPGPVLYGDQSSPYHPSAPQYANSGGRSPGEAEAAAQRYALQPISSRSPPLAGFPSEKPAGRDLGDSQGGAGPRQLYYQEDVPAAPSGGLQPHGFGSFAPFPASGFIDSGSGLGGDLSGGSEEPEDPFKSQIPGGFGFDGTFASAES